MNVSHVLGTDGAEDDAQLLSSAAGNVAAGVLQGWGGSPAAADAQRSQPPGS